MRYEAVLPDLLAHVDTHTSKNPHLLFQTNILSQLLLLLISYVTLVSLNSFINYRACTRFNELTEY